MFKRFIVLTLNVILVVSLIGCSKQDESIGGWDKAKCFQATIIEINNDVLTVEPDENSSERKSSDKIQVSIDHLNLDIKLSEGDEISIYYAGDIQETYPAVITGVVHLQLI